jgi:SAM-dependent methyltransferase
MEAAARLMCAYHDTRLAPDPRRAPVWKALWHYYFRHRIRPSDSVLDLGSAYGDFINNVVAERRIAIDLWPGFVAHLDEEVEAIVGSVTDLSAIADNSIDYAFASNLFEHLTQEQFADTLANLRAKLAPDGSLTILQPNYHYAYREYFDDYTHVSIYSHISLCDFLAANGFETVEVHRRFMPLTVKSRLPTWGWLVGLYLALPVKPFGKQMLVRARPKRR